MRFLVTISMFLNMGDNSLELFFK